MSDTPQSQNPGLLANILAVAGFIILVIVIVWGAYHLLRLTGSGVTSLFSRFGNSTEITVTAPREQVTSGKSFPITWKFSPKEAGSYALLYQCKSGFRFDATSASGSTAIPCGSAFTVGTSTSLTMIPMLSGASALEIPISIVFMPSATTSTTRPQGTATIRVAAAEGATPETKPVATTPTATPRPTQPVTKADISVHILAVGSINPSTGAFESRYPTGPNDIAAVQFDIGNNGGSSTGTYYFTVQLPMQDGYTYSSPIQMNLAPGSHVVNTLRFKPVQSGGGNIIVNVDTTYAVNESNEGNNSAAMFISTPTWTGSYAPYVY